VLFWFLVLADAAVRISKVITVALVLWQILTRDIRFLLLVFVGLIDFENIIFYRKMYLQALAMLPINQWFPTIFGYWGLCCKIRSFWGSLASRLKAKALFYNLAIPVTTNVF